MKQKVDSKGVKLDQERLRQIGEPLLLWYDRERRILPWREEPTPYRVWVSEIMLQQTRVSAVIGYFERFMKELPTIDALASCDEQRLLKLWEGLGYYNRVRNMQKAARELMQNYGGEIPKNYECIRQLPGIGEYTAGAISSIAFGLPYAAVDGNVLRVLSRILEWDEDIRFNSAKTEAKVALEAVLPSQVGDFNQALMELGAVICLPSAEPKCLVCPVARCCLAFQHKTMGDFPVKEKPKPRKVEERIVLLLQHNNTVALRKRPNKGLLASMWEFPNFEGNNSEQLIKSWICQHNMNSTSIRYWKSARHIFSHKEWKMKGYICSVSQPGKEFVWATKECCRKKYPLPTAFRAFSSLDFLEESDYPQ